MFSIVPFEVIWWCSYHLQPELLSILICKYFFWFANILRQMFSLCFHALLLDIVCLFNWSWHVDCFCHFTNHTIHLHPFQKKMYHSFFHFRILQFTSQEKVSFLIVFFLRTICIYKIFIILGNSMESSLEKQYQDFQ